MITMRRVGENHILKLCTIEDTTHLYSLVDFSDKPILTFDSSTNCWDGNGELQCRIQYVGENWETVTELPIKTKPVPFSKMEGVFDIEAEFCYHWLQLKGFEA